MIRLPDASFGEIAAVLVALAAQEAIGIELLEVLVARQEPGSVEAAIYGRSLADARQTAAILAGLQAALRAAAPHEAEIRGAFAAVLVEAAA